MPGARRTHDSGTSAEIRRLARDQLEISAVRTLESAHSIDATFLEWLASRDRVVCGSTAINEVLPHELKFFTDRTLPDYEVLTPNARGDAVELCATLKGRGSTPQMVADPDSGSHRVFVDAVLIARFTEIPKAVYKKLRATALVGDKGTSIAPVDYLRMTVLFELSRQTDVDAWNTTFDRLLRLNRAFGVGATSPATSATQQCEIDDAPELDEDAAALLSATRDALARPDAKEVMCGYAVAAMALSSGKTLPKAHARLDRQSTCMDVLSADPDATAQALLDAFTKAGKDNNIKKIVDAARIKRTATRGSPVFPRSVTLSLDGRPLVGVIHADRCVAFVKVDGIRIATIDTLMALYLRAFVIGRATDNVRCLCDLLATLEHKHFNSEQPMFKRYVTECYGLTHDNDS